MRLYTQLERLAIFIKQRRSSTLNLKLNPNFNFLVVEKKDKIIINKEFNIYVDPSGSIILLLLVGTLDNNSSTFPRQYFVSREATGYKLDTVTV